MGLGPDRPVGAVEVHVQVRDLGVVKLKLRLAGRGSALLLLLKGHLLGLLVLLIFSTT